MPELLDAVSLPDHAEGMTSAPHIIASLFALALPGVFNLGIAELVFIALVFVGGFFSLGVILLVIYLTRKDSRPANERDEEGDDPNATRRRTP